MNGLLLTQNIFKGGGGILSKTGTRKTKSPRPAKNSSSPPKKSSSRKSSSPMSPVKKSSSS